MAREYEAKGVAYLHVCSGEAERTVIDFARHYRSRAPHLIDPVRALERRWNRNGWPFHLVAGPDGRVVFAETLSLVRPSDLRAVRAALDTVAPGRAPETVVRLGTRYAAATIARAGAVRRQAFPSLAFDNAGGLYQAWTQDGHSIRARLPGGREVDASAGLEDAYRAVLVRHPQRGVWAVSCARSKSGRYDIFVRRLSHLGELSPAENVSGSEDDAMHPCAALDDRGRLWVAWYAWERMGAYSRDKEIYARRLDGDSWSDVVRVSPADLPVYEDHTDPALAPGPDGGVSVAWSWDMHRMEKPVYARYQKSYGAGGPTIFGRTLRRDGEAGQLLFLGQAHIDSTPELWRAADGTLWCAYVTLGADDRKHLNVSALPPGRVDRTGYYAPCTGVLDVDSPRFYELGGVVNLVWSARTATGWQLRRATWSGRGWTAARTPATKPNPRHPAVAVHPNGREAAIAYVSGGVRCLLKTK